MSFDSGKDVIVFIADNGSGKTSLLDALAEFLRFFRHKAIYAAHGSNETLSVNGRIDPRYDVTNGTLISEGRVILEIEYPFIPVELLEWLCACIDWLNEVEVNGSAAALVFDDEESMYVLSVRQAPEGKSGSEMVADYVLPETLMSSLNGIQTSTRQSLIEFLDEQIRNAEYELHFASNTGGNWEMSPDFDLVSFPTVHKGTVSLKFSMNARVPDSLSFHVEESRPRDVEILIESLKKGKAYIEDFANAPSSRSPYEDGESLDMTYPLLVYYGGSAISTRFDKKLKLPYSAGWFQP
ncbi:MAG: ATP-binding protein, partial [Methanobacteriota archaeon]